MFGFDLSVYLSAVVSGIPIFFIVIGLVEVVKSLGVAGKALRGVAVALGLLFGVGYEIATLGLPVLFADYFAYAVYGLGLGILSFWTYDLGKGLIDKAVAKYIGEEKPPDTTYPPYG